jgi:ELWxxDGT repeat protein
VALLFPALLPGGPLTAQPTLLKDINTSPAGSQPEQFAELNGALYFMANSAAGRELYRTDGTAAGASLVKDISPRTDFLPPNLPDRMVAAGNLLFFRKDDGVHGTELWKSDGTAAGTVLVKDINPGPASSPTTLFTPVAVNGVLYFNASEGKNGHELWKSDGTAAGTVLVKDVTPGASGSDLTNLTAFNGRLYFIKRSSGSRQLWQSDGTAAGTVLVKELAAGLPGLESTELAEANGVLYFGLINGPGASDALWRSDGTEAGTYKVKDLVTGKQSPVSNSLSAPVNSGGTLYFTHLSQGLWKSDGTAAGTVLVRGFPFPNERADGSSLAAFPGGVYFSAFTNATGSELWKSDGTAAGTIMVKDLNPGTGHSFPTHLTLLNGKLYFDITTSFNSLDRQLWSSDGTAAGTQLVKAIPSSLTASPYQRWAVFNNHLYFGASDATHGYELWKSDGTTAGTAMVSDIHAGSYGSELAGYAESGGKLFFTATEQGAFFDGATASMLFGTDGTPEGTASVHQVNVPGSLASGYGLTSVSPNLFFYVSSSGLYKTNGTAGSQSLVKSFRYTPSQLASVNGTLYFVAEDGTYGEELWKSDGTPAGTVLVKDINPSQGFFLYSGTVGLNGLLFFRVDDGTHGMDLWRSDGTAAGTFLLKDFEGTSFGEGPSLPVFYKGEYYFAASDGLRGRELWKTNGTTAGTVLVADIAAGAGSSGPARLSVNPNTNTLYFTADDGTHGRELWRSDGTQNGTSLVKDTHPNGDLLIESQLLALDNALLFIADNGENGRELWRTDGTAAGTQLVKDINPGSAGAFPGPYSLCLLNGVVYFSASNGTHGLELWRNDGTAAGTFMLADLLPGSLSSTPAQFYAWGGSLYFVATDAARGRELWRYAPAALLTVFSTSPLCAGSTLSVPFDAGKQAFNPGNVFTVELSDAGGSFRAPQAIGTLAATGPAAIAATLPAGTVPGSGYRVRVRASSPALTGSDNGNNLTVAAPPVAAITVSGATLTASEGTAYRWFLDGAALTPVTRTLQAQQSGTYAVEVTNADGCVARSAGITVEVTGIESPGAGGWTVFPNPSGGPVTVAFAAPRWGGARLTLVDARGNTVQAATVPAGAAGETLQLDLTPCAPGVYLLVLHGEGKAAYRKIVKR